MSNNIFIARSGITAVEERPNIIVTYPEGADPSCADMLSGILTREEINVYTEAEGDILLKTLCPMGSWHMVILADGGLSAPGFHIIEKIRKFSDVPVLTVSEDANEIYKIMALAKGADVCMEYGDNCRHEFKARVISLLRRHLGYNCEENIICADGKDTLSNGAISVDRRKREVYSQGRMIKLTAIEYGIVEYLMENCGDVCTVEDIYRRVWNENPYCVKKTVVEHIRRIRCKIEPDPKKPSYIKVVFGVGYKMERAS